MDAYVIGISGIGKEHVRVLLELGIERIGLVDFQEVLNKEISDKGTLRNTFPGHEFEITLPDSCAFLTPEDVPDRIQKGSVVFVCTPPTWAGRGFIPSLTSHRILIEKPNRPRFFGHSVGYLYETAPHPQQSVKLVVPPPPKDSWRLRIDHYPALWDAGGHALSTLAASQISRLRVVSLGQGTFLARTDDIEVDVSYGHNDHSDIVIDGVRNSWNTYFRDQLERFVGGEEVGQHWIMIENTLERLQRSADIHRSST